MKLGVHKGRLGTPMPENVSDALEGLAAAEEMHRQGVAQNVSTAASSNDARLVELALKPGVHPAP